MRMISWRRVATTVTASIAATAALGGTASADVPFAFNPTGMTFTQAGNGAGINGGHPDVTIGFALQTDPTTPTNRPPQGPRTATVTLPEGLVGDPKAVPATCPMDAVVLTEKTEGRGLCPRAAAAGMVLVDAAYPNTGSLPGQDRRLWRVPAGRNEVVAFGTSIISVPIRIGVSVTPSGGYRVQATGDNLPQAALVRAFRVTLWGVPADHQGLPTNPDGSLAAPSDPRWRCDGYFSPFVPGLRLCQDNLPVGRGDINPENRFGAPLPGAERRPFMTNASVCGASADAGVRIVPYGTVFEPIETTLNAGSFTGCENQPFDPSIDVTPKSQAAGQPSGYTVGIDVPQNMDPEGQGTAHVKDVSVALPKGVAISPPSANGLDACSDAQLDLNGDSDPACPNASKIGSLTIETPVLEDPVQGSAYLGTQLSNDPMSGEMYRLFLVAKTSGVLIKLKGAIKADPVTGQLNATFENNPQLPFSRMELRLDDGNRASLANPKACGTYTTSAKLTSYAGHVKDLSSSYVIDEGCPSGHFRPFFTAGTVNPFAGGYSPFNMAVSRTDADQELSRLNIEMPSGLLAALGSVPLCGSAQAVAGTCPAASRIGSTTVLVGSGGEPLPLAGTVSVTGPYKGAPFGLSVVVPAKVGPFDLGDVVVRAALHVNGDEGRATAMTDPFPTIVGGVPVRLRQVNVSLDRPGFMFNPTSCQHQSINGGFWSTAGAGAARRVPFQAQGCDKLKVSPRIGLEWTGKTQMRKGKHPGVEAKLGDMLGQANLKQVKVTLPLTAALDPQNAKALCEPSAAAINQCPADSRVGWASASTPALHDRVSGPVYFVRGIRISETGREIGSLPKLYVPLVGQGVQVNLWADSDVDSKQRLVSTFKNIPDVPVRDFKLSINSGSDGILEATNDVCGAPKTTTIEYTGHHDGVNVQRVNFTAPDCKPQIVSAENSRNSTLPVRVGGIGPGKLTLSGKGIGRAVRNVVRSDAARIRAKLTRNARSHLRSGKSFRTRLTVKYEPKEGKTVNIRKTVTVKPIER
ncbi:MAG: hypothetical protein ITG02_09575 [Patulibacter sp.]|nr:hypothetical protein [Patulibacter sp.]